ncbi:uncharacterized protein LOC142585605 isoform X2 [Dermacentor variabilis]|uniref:uncharacterized protein LOC142585605 isoform X2 n=1 Tax=Dermacentor variabilis TaxID=34621 RepID=UPI003F5AEB4B
MEHQPSQSGKPPVDEIKVIPLPCYGRGSKLIPLDELPLFQYLKRQAALQGGAQSPGPQSLHLADRHHYMPHTSGPPTPSHNQTDRPSRHSIQPSPSTSKQCHFVLPVKSLPKGPSGSDCHGGARRKMPATSPNRGQGVSRSPKAQPPAKKAAFGPDSLSHSKDHSSWAEFLTKGVTHDPVDDSEGDLTICRDAEAQQCDTPTFPPDLEDKVTVCNEDEAKRHESDSPSAGGKPAAVVKDEPMETEESEEPKKDEVGSED